MNSITVKMEEVTTYDYDIPLSVASTTSDIRLYVREAKRDLGNLRIVI